MLRPISIVFLIVFSGCSLSEKSGPGAPSSGLIITPPSYYSTPKARALGERYNRNLEQLVRQLVQDPVTGKLQFANNIASVGGIGFFTHSGSPLPDERYLEVVLGAPEVFDDREDFNYKIERIISLYGAELISILTSDSEIYNDKDVAGYGLNFSWRVTSSVSGTSRVGMERAVIYVSKDKAREFLDQRLSAALLGASVIYAIGTDALPIRIAYAPYDKIRQQADSLAGESQAKELEVAKAGVEPIIQEQNLFVAEPVETPTVPPVREEPSLANEPKQQELTKPAAKQSATQENDAPKRKVEAGSGIKIPAVKSPVIASEEVKTVSPPVEAPKRSVAREEKGSERQQPVQPVVEEQGARLKEPQKGKAETSSVTEISNTKKPAVPSEEVRTVSPPLVSSTRSVPVEEKVEPKLVLKESRSGPVERIPREPNRSQRAGQGYLVQLSFSERVEAERWSDILIQEGYSVSASAIKGAQVIRLRVDGFGSSGEASRFLEKLRGQGLTGTVLFQVTGDQTLLAAGDAAREPGVATPEGDIIGREKSVEERLATPERAAGKIEAIGPVAVKKELSVVEPAAAKEVVAPPVKKAAPEERPEPKIVLKEKTPNTAERKPPPVTLLKPPVMHGYLVQVSFPESAEAERWSELLSREGYATSITTIRGDQVVRLRVGAFTSSGEADRLLKRLNKDGLTGFVVQGIK